MDKKEANKKESKVRLKKRLIRRIFILNTMFFLLIVGLTIKVGYIKITKGSEYEKEVLKTMTDTQREIKPQRGSIVDRNNKYISSSTITYNLILDSKTILEMDNEKREAIYKILSDYSKKSVAEINSIVQKSPTSRYSIFLKDLSSADMLKIKEKGVKGIYFEESFIRNYPKGELASHVIGFFNKNGQGQYGIEQYYNQYLEGKPGRVFSQLQKGDIITSEIVSPVNGGTVILTIDEVVQQYVEQTMIKYIKEYNPIDASAIVMNPKTGEIYAMYSYPTFDPNNYSSLEKQVGTEKWKKMTEEERDELRYRSWRNYNTQHPYEPGSTFKPLLAAEAIEEGIVSLNDTYECPGAIQIADTTIGCWKQGGHGKITIEEGLAQSCNVAMIEIGQKIVDSTFTNYLSKYGFGEKTGIDLPGEEVGILHKKLSSVDKATNSMGQNFTCTPIQLLTGFASVINGGYLMEPYVVSQITDENNSVIYEKKPTVRRQVISKQTSDIVREYLRSVITRGTGTSAGIDGYSIGGKTGTAEKQPRSAKKHVISFVGYAPVNDPEVITLILFDEAPEHSGAPAKAFNEMMEKILPYLDIDTDVSINAEETENIEVGNYIGMELYKAATEIEASGLQYETVGVGKKIKNQYPAKGIKKQRGEKVTLYLTSDNLDLITEVPDLKGLTISEAQKFVGETFVIKGNGAGIIDSQIPAAKQKIEKGSEIIVQTIE